MRNELWKKGSARLRKNVITDVWQNGPLFEPLFPLFQGCPVSFFQRVMFFFNWPGFPYARSVKGKELFQRIADHSFKEWCFDGLRRVGQRYKQRPFKSSNDFFYDRNNHFCTITWCESIKIVKMAPAGREFVRSPGLNSVAVTDASNIVVRRLHKLLHISVSNVISHESHKHRFICLTKFSCRNHHASTPTPVRWNRMILNLSLIWGRQSAAVEDRRSKHSLGMRLIFSHLKLLVAILINKATCVFFHYTH